MTELFDQNWEILTEHLGFTPTDLIDDVINSVNELLYQALNSLEDLLTERFADDDFEKALAEIETLFENSVDKHFDKFELFCLKNIFSLPKDLNVVLPHYETTFFDPLREMKKVDVGIEDDNLDAELENLRSQILAQKYLHYHLCKKVTMNESKLERIFQIQQCLMENFSNELNGKVSTSNLSLRIDDLRLLLKQTKGRCIKSNVEGKGENFFEVVLNVDQRIKFIGNSIQSYLERQNLQKNDSTTNCSNSENNKILNVNEFKLDFHEMQEIGNPDGGFSLGYDGCSFLAFMTVFTCGISLMSCLGLTYDRYSVIVRGNIISRSFVSKYVVGSWIICTLLASLPYMAKAQGKTFALEPSLTLCIVAWESKMNFSFIMITPVFFIAYAYTMIYLKVRQNSKSLSKASDDNKNLSIPQIKVHNTSGKSINHSSLSINKSQCALNKQVAQTKKLENRVLMQSIAIVTSFLGAWTPYLIRILYEVISGVR
ncbi:hypothetical protein HK099_005466, partial [Clydaea vesicula]